MIDSDRSTHIRRVPAAGPARAPARRARAWVLAGALAIGPLPAAANPTGATVQAGTATITESDTDLDVHQSTAKAILDWRGFSIDADETTRFHQPSAGAITLNRVTGADPSHILGTLQANGQIMLVNPNGILFGAGSRVDVAGLVATTADIGNDDFLAGDYDFTVPSSNPNAAVVNEGDITVAEAGYAALVAPAVRNDGTISARLGRVALGGADAFTLDLYGDNLVTFRLGVDETPKDADGQDVAALVDNSGTIMADGGRVTLAAENIGAVVRNVINMDGIVQANSIARANGEVVIDAAGPGVVRVEGTLGARGDDAGETGGRVQVTGERVGLFGDALVDVSGAAGGGEALVGGNYQGQGPERNADQTLIGRDARIVADAVGEGDGGRVIVWADGTTQFLGEISARGGAAGGDGGFAEVSDKTRLRFDGRVDLAAPAGGVGTLLLDPIDIVISNADGTDGITGGTIGFVDSPGAEPWNVTPAQLDAVAGNVTLQALNDITFIDAVMLTTGGASLNAQAGNAINVDNAITTTGGDVTLNGDSVVFLAAGDVTTSGGDVFVTANNGGIAMAAGTLIDAGAGRIETTGSNSAVTLGQMTTTSAATATGAEAIRIVSGGGITFLSTVSASGNIVVQTASAAQALTVGGGALANLLAGNRLILGRADGTATLTVIATTLKSATTFRNNADIDVQGTIINDTAGGSTVFDAGAGAILFTGGGGTRVSNNGGAVTFNSDLELDGSAYTLLSSGGDVTLQGILDTSGTGSGLTVSAGAGAYSSAAADLGLAAGTFDATAATIALGNGLIADTATLNGAATGSELNVRSLTITGPSANLFGTVNGRSGDDAAAQATMPDALTHLINGCTKSACPGAEPESAALDTVYAVSTPETFDGTTSDPVVSVESALTEAHSETGGEFGESGGDVYEIGDWAEGSYDVLAVDPLMAPTRVLGLDDFALRLEDAELDDAQLLETAETNGDAELAGLTQDLLWLLGEYEIASADDVPGDAFNGVATVIVPGILTFQPRGSDDPETVYPVYQPSGFARYQF